MTSEQSSSIGISDDYIHIITKNGTKVYFGYEETVGIGSEREWAFTYEYGYDKIVIPESQLGLTTAKEDGDFPTKGAILGLIKIIESLVDEGGSSLSDIT